MKHTGRHVILDGLVRSCDFVAGDDLLRLMESAAKAGGATPLEGKVIELPIGGVSKIDSPPGGTAWLALDESAITLHWYLDGDMVQFALDVFTCGSKADTLKIADCFSTAIGVERITKFDVLSRFGAV